MIRRVLFINTVGQMGGAEHSLLGLLSGLDRQRYRPGLACPPGSDLARRARAAGVAVAELPLATAYVLRSPGAYARSLAAVGRLIGGWRPDIIHGNGVRSVHYAVPLGRMARVPAIVHVRDIALPPSRLARALLRAADAQIAISTAVSAMLADRGLRAARCPVVYNGIDVARFSSAAAARDAARAALGLEPGAVAIGMVGRLLPEKGQHTLVATAGLLSPTPGLRWLIVGDEWVSATARPGARGYREQLQAQIAALGLAERVTLLGGRDDIPALMAALDIVVVPSLEPEALGRVAIEAMAAGRPVIASDAGGLVEIVVDGETGFLVPPGDPGALAARVHELAARPELRRSLGARGAARARDCFSQEAYVEGVSRVYEALLEPR